MHRRDAETVTCQLCMREIPRDLITLHHLKPKQKGGKAEDRTPLCKPCHKQLHATYSNKELATDYLTVESLREAKALQPFLGWIRKQKPDRVFRTMVSSDHPHRRRMERRRYR